MKGKSLYKKGKKSLSLSEEELLCMRMSRDYNEVCLTPQKTIYVSKKGRLSLVREKNFIPIGRVDSFGIPSFNIAISRNEMKPIIRELSPRVR